MTKHYFVEYEYQTASMEISPIRHSTGSGIIDYHPAFFVQEFRKNWFLQSASLYAVTLTKWTELTEEEFASNPEGKSKFSEHDKELLTKYTEFLLKEGYCDSDVVAEGNSAIDRFMHPELNK
jgi:hypothetical protein